MKRSYAGVLFVSQAWAVTLISHERRGNHIDLRCSEGSASITWLSASTFRFQRTWTGESLSSPGADPVPLALEDSAVTLLLKTQALLVQIAKDGLLVRVETSSAKRLLEDLTEPRKTADGISWARGAPPAVRYYGLGPRDDPKIDMRGRRIRALQPFLLSTAGYAESHLSPGSYLFDIAASQSDRYGIEIQGADRIDYYFYSGRSPKEIFQERAPTAAPFAGFSTERLTVPQLINGSLSGNVSAVFDLAPYEHGNLQIRLLPYYETYAQEAALGLPLVRALPLQFPADVQAANFADEFMLGDEVLTAPMKPAARERSVYLPKGHWTRLKTDERVRGPRVIQIRAAPGELPLFSRDGSVLPAGPPVKGGPITLNYFPTLSGEFFLFEPQAGGFTPVHAALAGDLLRLEIGSKTAREYVWLVHHVDRPRKVFHGDAECPEMKKVSLLRPGAWFYDSTTRNLYLHLHLRAGEDGVATVQWK